MTDNPIIVTRFHKETLAGPSSLTISPEFKDSNATIREYRRKSWNTFNLLPMPTEKDEDWRRTSLRNIAFDKFTIIDPADQSKTQFPPQLIEPMADRKHGGQVLISPWEARIQLDEEIEKRGVVFEDIKTAAEKHPKILEKVIHRIDTAKNRKFSALAGALELNGILLYVPRGVAVDSPLQSVYWAPCSGHVHGLHVLVYLEEDSSVTYVHESSSPTQADADSLHTGVMEIYVGSNAHLNFVELQSWGENVVNFTSENVSVEKSGSVDWIFGALGSKLTKNYSDLNLIGQGSSGKVSGFYFTDNQQHLDHDTQQNHLAPDTTSDLLFKGALIDQSRSVWEGMIYVAPNASKTDGYQANRNLVLSKKARADSIPGLEILTDDVKCTHGATVGKIDEDQVFYLMSRGMTRETSERLIVEGFFDPIMQRIPFEGVKKRFQTAIQEKMENIAINK